MIGENGKRINEEQVIILIDSSSSISELEKIIVKNKIRIITFDYASHIELKNKNIIHTISESYNSTIDINELQKKCYSFLKWHEERTVRDNLQFHGINIPKLFTDQLWHSIIKVVKKFSEVQEIYNQYPDSKYIANGDLLEIIKIFTSSCVKLGDTATEKFYFDEIEVGINIGRKEFTFSISKFWYDKIKNMSESILQFFVAKHSNNIDKNATLLVEFHTKNFEDFLIAGKKQNKNILFYGRRRPAIWDLKSFKIIRKSKCKIINLKELRDDSFSNDHQISVKNVKEKLSFLLENDELLHDFFKINGFSIWPIVKTKIKNLIESKIEMVIHEILLARKIFELYPISSVLVISEAGLTEQIAVKQAKDFGVPVFHLQEGLYYDTPEAYENESLQGIYPELADEYFAWGDTFKEDVIKNGKIDPQKIKAFGSPRFSNLYFDNSLNSEEFILLATMPPQIEEITGHDVRNLERYLKSIINICEIVSNQKKKLVIKLHPTFDILEISNNVKKKFPDIKIISKGDINPLIRRCSMLIVTGLSTVIIQGHILQKPVISIPLIDYNWGNPSVFKSGSCIITNVVELDKLIKKILEDRVFREGILEKGNKFLEKCIKDRESSSNIVWKYICKFNY